MHLSNEDNPENIRKEFARRNIHISGPILHTAAQEKSLKKQTPNYSYIRHSHSFHEMVFIKSGSALHWIDGTRYPVQAGDVFLITGKTEHFFEKTRDLVLYNLMIKDPAFGIPENDLEQTAGYQALFFHEPEFRRKTGFRSRLKLNLRQLAEAERRIRAIQQEQDHPQTGSNTAIRAQYFLLITHLIRTYQSGAEGSARALLRISFLFSLLEKHYPEEWSLKRMCQESALSRTSLSRYFRSAVGSAPGTYLLELRLSRAEDLLRTTTEDITEIAYRCGFSDSNYFSRIFRKHRAFSPSEFRKQENNFFI